MAPWGPPPPNLGHGGHYGGQEEQFGGQGMEEYVEDEGAPGEENVEEVEQITDSRDGGKEEQGRNVDHTAQDSTEVCIVFLNWIKFRTFSLFTAGGGII